MNARHRTTLALVTAGVLTLAGVAVVANGVGGPAETPTADATQAVPAAPTTTTASPSSAELERSVQDLLGQVSSLEAELATTTAPTPSGVGFAAVDGSYASSDDSDYGDSDYRDDDYLDDDDYGDDDSYDDHEDDDESEYESDDRDDDDDSHEDEHGSDDD